MKRSTARRTPAFASEGLPEVLEALRESEERLRMVVRNAPVVLWAIDRRGLFTFLDGRGLAALGSRAAASVGRSVFEVYANDPEVIENSRRVLAGEEFTAVGEVGGVWFETLFSPLRDATGRVVGAMGVSTDVTHRRRAEEELQASEAKFRKIFHESPGAIAINRRSDGRYREVNDEFLRLTERTREEVLGRKPEELGIRVNPEDLGKVVEGIRSRGLVRDLEAEIPTRSGAIRSILFSAASIDVAGEPCVLSFLHDVTERKQAEVTLRLVSGRLLQSQDEERRRIARELHDSTAQGLASVAMNLALVERGAPALDSRARAALAEAVALVEQCSREVRTLSYLLHPPMLDEVGLVSAMRGYVDGFAERSGIRVEVDVPRDLGRFPREIELTLFRIVQESLTNIHRHSGSATASVRIEKSAGIVALEVADQGRGATRRLESMPDGAARLGVGIAGMRERVRQLRGRFQLESVEGRGTTVRATLPLEPEVP